jgi:superfamily II DNA/RNA helicase
MLSTSDQVRYMLICQTLSKILLKLMEVIKLVCSFSEVIANSFEEALIPMLQEEDKKHEQNLHHQVIIFCNTVQSCRAVHHAVIESGLEASCYHSEMPSQAQADEFARFREGRTRFIVSTDLAARGIDLPDIRHVIMFDFPLNVVDFLHRTGRTGRMNPNTGTLSHGKVTCLLNRKREVALAEQIRSHTRSKKSLETVNSQPRKRIMGKQVVPKSIVGKRQQYWLQHKDRLLKNMKDKKPKDEKKGETKTRTAASMSWKRKSYAGLDPSLKLEDKISIKNPASKLAKQRRVEKKKAEQK